ncbi:MAG: YraN family protein [Paraperlucidibaca sp.]
MSPPESTLKAGSPSQQQGRLAEQDACALMIRAGHRVIAQNYLCRAGEIDIISVNHHGKLVFTEVRWRRNGQFGSGQATVTSKKQHKVIKTAALFLRRHPHYATFCIRFDVIAYSGTPPHWQHDWLRGAFSAF